MPGACGWTQVSRQKPSCGMRLPLARRCIFGALPGGLFGLAVDGNGPASSRSRTSNRSCPPTMMPLVAADTVFSHQRACAPPQPSTSATFNRQLSQLMDDSTQIIVSSKAYRRHNLLVGILVVGCKVMRTGRRRSQWWYHFARDQGYVQLPQFDALLVCSSRSRPVCTLALASWSGSKRDDSSACRQCSASRGCPSDSNLDANRDRAVDTLRSTLEDMS